MFMTRCPMCDGAYLVGGEHDCPMKFSHPSERDFLPAGPLVTKAAPKVRKKARHKGGATIAAQQPWIEAGMSRAKWYQLRKEQAVRDGLIRPGERMDYSGYTKQVIGGEEAQG